MYIEQEYEQGPIIVPYDVDMTRDNSALTGHRLPFKAAVTFGAIIDMTAVIDAFAAFFGIGYNWTDERRALAERLSSVHRAPALAIAIRAEGGRAELGIVPNVAHAFVDEPGEAAVPQGHLT